MSLLDIIYCYLHKYRPRKLYRGIQYNSSQYIVKSTPQNPQYFCAIYEDYSSEKYGDKDRISMTDLVRAFRKTSKYHRKQVKKLKDRGSIAMSLCYLVVLSLDDDIDDELNSIKINEDLQWIYSNNYMAQVHYSSSAGNTEKLLSFLRKNSKDKLIASDKILWYA